MCLSCLAFLELLPLFFFLSEDSKRLFLFIIFYSRSIIPFFFSFPRLFSKQNLLLIILVFVSLFFFSFTVLYRVCVLLSSCVFLVSALVCTFFFFSAFKKKTFLLQREKKTRREGAPVEVAQCSSSFFFFNYGQWIKCVEHLLLVETNGMCVCVCVCARDDPFSFSVLTSASFASVPFFLCSYYYYISIIRYWSPKQVFVEPEQLRKDVVECPQLYSFEKKVDLSYWYIAFLFFCSFYYPIKHYFLPIPPKCSCYAAESDEALEAKRATWKPEGQSAMATARAAQVRRNFLFFTAFFFSVWRTVFVGWRCPTTFLFLFFFFFFG